MSVNNFIDHSSSPFITRQHRISYINPHSIPKAAPNNTELAEYFDIQYYDGKVSILKFLGFWKLLKVCVHEGVRKMVCLSLLFLNVLQFIRYLLVCALILLVAFYSTNCFHVSTYMRYSID